MEDDKAFQGVICIHSLDFIYMFHVHRLLVLYVQGITMWSLCCPWTLEEWPWEQIAVWARSFFRRERQLGVTYQCLHMEVGRCPQQEEITCEAGETYHLSVDRLFRKTEGRTEKDWGRKEDCFIWK